MSIIGVAFLCFTLGGYILLRPVTPPVYCDGDFREYAGDGRLIVSMNLALKNGKGTITLKGKVIDPDEKEIPFYIRKYAAYQFQGDVLVLSKTEQPLFVTSNTDVHMLKGYLQAFFLDNSSPQFTVRMYRIEERDDTWIVSATGKLPYFLCIDH